MKLPFPGFSSLITTVARPARPFCTFPALVLNAPHCLHASTRTTGREEEEEEAADLDELEWERKRTREREKDGMISTFLHEA